MTMVERVARAICKANWLDVAGDFADEKNWQDWLPEARAAIAAMREPSQTMLDAMDAVPFLCGSADFYRAAIIAALAEGDEP